MAGEIARDLFGGLRQLPSGGRGRPSHCWSQENENRVIMGLVMGLSDQKIAHGLKISLYQLRRYYSSALASREMERTRFELWRAEKLANLANEGNVGAMKELSKIIEKRDRHLAEERLRLSPQPEKLGKKQIDKVKARDAEADLMAELEIEAGKRVRPN
jgi:hypothetical protein